MKSQPLTVLDQELEYDECMDILNYGMFGNVSIFSNMQDMNQKYHAYEKEILNTLNEYCNDRYSQGALNYVAEQLSYDDKFWTMEDMKEYLMWMYVEVRAYDYVDSLDDE